MSSLTYDNVNSVLEIQGEFKVDLIESNKQIAIDFLPSNSLIPEYFASVDQAFILKLEATTFFYSPFTLGLLKILPYILWVIVGVGWLVFVAGFIVKQLAGL